MAFKPARYRKTLSSFTLQYLDEFVILARKNKRFSDDTQMAGKAKLRMLDIKNTKL